MKTKRKTPSILRHSKRTGCANIVRVYVCELISILSIIKTEEINHSTVIWGFHQTCVNRVRSAFVRCLFRRNPATYRNWNDLNEIRNEKNEKKKCFNITVASFTERQQPLLLLIDLLNNQYMLIDQVLLSMEISKRIVLKKNRYITSCIIAMNIIIIIFIVFVPTFLLTKFQEHTICR